jgi:hypothetical protein
VLLPNVPALPKAGLGAPNAGAEPNGAEGAADGAEPKAGADCVDDPNRFRGLMAAPPNGLELGVDPNVGAGDPSTPNELKPKPEQKSNKKILMIKELN